MSYEENFHALISDQGDAGPEERGLVELGVTGC